MTTLDTRRLRGHKRIDGFGRELPDAYNPAVSLLILFFLSGAASLVLESVFRRELALFVGSDVTATSLTLAIFLGGLAAGAALFGRIADRASRPLRLYAQLELGVGVTGALAVGVLAFGRGALVAPVRAAGPAGVLVAGALACALLLPPTVLMGGTLPALTRHRLRGGGSMLGSLAVLYGVNTLGASLGAACSGFLLFEALGISGTGWLGAGLAGLVGAGAWALDGQESRRVVRAPFASREGRGAVADPFPAGARQAALVAATVGGAVALGYEVVWTRLLVLPLRSYAYSFSLMLSLFLLGLVLGSLALARFERRIGSPVKVLALVQLASGAYVAASVAWLPAVLSPPSEGRGLGALILSGWLRAGPIVLPPTLLSGMALPLAVRVFSREPERPGSAVGTVYAANTLGAIAGALAAGLGLLPAFGASRALAILAALGASSGAAVSLVAWPGRAARWVGLAVAAGCLAAVVLPARPFVEAFSRTGGAQRAVPAPLYFREGATDTVAVVRRDYGFRDASAKSVVVNGIAMTATVKPVWRYMSAEGHLPALFARSPARALVICVGTGITLGALASHASVSSIDAVDLSESMLGALPVFERENRAAYRDPKVRIVHADGRQVLELSEKTYDLITLEPPPPIVAGSVHLYTLDFYRLCRERLDRGGIVAQWLPLHAQSLRSAKATAHTFLEAFPYVQLWLPSIRDAVLIGSDRPLRLDPESLRAAYASNVTHASLVDAYFETPEALLATYLLDREGVLRWSAGADLITDDRPSIEFFRGYGPTMSDREIATLLEPPLGSLDDLEGKDGDPALRLRLAAARDAHLLYVRADIDKDPARSREAALASRSTRFGLYRLGCDGPQLDALRATPASEVAWRRQVDYCGGLQPTGP